jgi:ATP-dependent Lon protease
MEEIEERKDNVDFLEESNPTVKLDELMPLLPLRGMIIFPGMIINLDVGRERSVKAVEEAMEGNRKILLVSQKKATTMEPEEKDLFTVGTVVTIKQLLKLPNGAVRILVEGLNRSKIVKIIDDKVSMFKCECVEIKDVIEDSKEVEALKRMLVETFEKWILASKKITSDILLTFKDEVNPSKIADIIAGYININVEEKQKILEAYNVKERLVLLYENLSKELEIANLEKTIAQQVRKQVEQNQKEYYLREQIKAINKELNEDDERQVQIDAYKAQMEELDLPEKVVEKINKELERLHKMSPLMAESSVIRNYIEVLLELPWNKFTEDNYDLDYAKKVLNEEHYGLDKIKERILEYLAVRAITKKVKGSILCLVGPPGVGKTSLARSIAKAMNRKFTRLSLGGVRDEAEIRGHRRTYIGAMPGRIIAGMQSVGYMNPLFLLDEIDKMGYSYNGDPGAAMLEVLDPEQNSTFSDHFVEFPFDLSNVFWIVTANSVDTIPPALYDRMEVIRLDSYTDDEKIKIAERHLIPKERKKHGLTESNFKISNDAILRIIRDYTREAGVRSLERTIAALCRKGAHRLVTEKINNVHVTTKTLAKYLGPIKYLESDMTARAEVGIATGLAWTSIGGELLKVEVAVIPGKGHLQLTGQLGDVMKESAQAAYTYLRSRSEELGLEPKFYGTHDVHIHLPEGAIPKDGPSAGITMAIAMISAFTKRKIKAGLAMTGEITLSGRVLPVGGIKEKMLAANRYKIKKILLPEQNQQDLEELPKKVLNAIEFIPVKHMDEVIKLALED